MTPLRPAHAPSKARPSALNLALAAVFSALAALAPQSAQAESLKELVDAARSTDATYLSARALADSAQYKAAQADALRLPIVGLQGTLARSQADLPLTGNRTLNATTLGITGTQPLYNRANAATIGKAGLALDAAKADLQAAEQDLIVRVAQAYFDVLSAEVALTTAKANRQAIGEQLNSAQARFKAGDATITDTREAQARQDLATAQELAADNDLRTKRSLLDQLVGRGGVQPQPLAQPAKLPDFTVEPMDNWLTRSTQSPTVRKAQLGYEIAKLEVDRTEAGHLPTLDLTAGIGGTRYTGSGANSGANGGAGNGTNNRIGLTLNLPLFAGFAVQNQVKEAVALQEKSRQDLEAARRAVAQATRQLYFGVQSGQSQVAALEAAESSSQLALDATKLGYQVGVRVNIDVLNAQTQLYTTQRDLAKARNDVIVNALKLRQASGVLMLSDVDAVESLIVK